MPTVYKYDVPTQDRFTLRLPRHAKILAFQAQRDRPQIWALVDPHSLEHVDREFRLAGTGHPIEESETDLCYIGSCQMREAALVWHLFEYLLPF